VPKAGSKMPRSGEFASKLLNGVSNLIVKAVAEIPVI